MKIQTSTDENCLSSSDLMPAGDDFPAFLKQSARILDSYRHWFGKDLVSRNGSLEDQSELLFNCNQVVLSSGNEPDAILNYGNRSALNLWEMSWATLTSMPSRLTAQPMERPEREAFLQQVRQNGFITDYAGVRISRTGRRFKISAATVWNILDVNGDFLGQAAAFSRWENLT
ncbi:MAG: MEKHLA domain-containing protein [Hyphomicrobiales bacterium]